MLAISFGLADIGAQRQPLSSIQRLKRVLAALVVRRALPGWPEFEDGMTQNSQWQPSDIMNAETGNDPESPKKRGRIPQSAWPRILERYKAGATLSAIAREFECTPSAISYIVRKAEAAGGLAEDGASETTAEPAPETAATPEATAEPAAAPVTAEEPPVAKTVPVAASAPAPLAASAPAPVAVPAAERPARPPLTTRPPRPEPLPSTTAPTSAPVATPATAAPASAEAPAVAKPAAGRPEPTPPVDATEGRLRETARGCLSAYRGWRQGPGENTLQGLSDAVHELRKVLSRIEIDMSASRREEQAIRPIPIPAHRSARRPQ